MQVHADIKKLSGIIKDNPGCTIRIDNDGWEIFDQELYDKYDFPERDDHWDEIVLADSSDYAHCWVNGWGDASCYGAAVLEALAYLQKVNVESV